MNLRVLADRFAVCRLPAGSEFPRGLDESALFSITRTARELSVVCRESEHLPGEIENGWRCLEVEGPLEFDQVGIFASLAQPLAEAGISIFALSTYDTDYILLKDEQLAAAIVALRAAGHDIS